MFNWLKKKSQEEKALEHAKELTGTLSYMRAADKAADTHNVDFIILFNQLMDWIDIKDAFEHDKRQQFLAMKYPTVFKPKEFSPCNRAPFQLPQHV